MSMGDSRNTRIVAPTTESRLVTFPSASANARTTSFRRPVTTRSVVSSQIASVPATVPSSSVTGE